MPRTALVALAVCAVAVGTGALAWACTPSAVIDLNGADAGPPGSTFTVNGRGFGANNAVSITFDGQPVGSAQASASGYFTTSATVPANAAPGRHTVAATSSEGSAPATYLVTGGPDPQQPGSPPPAGEKPSSGAPADSPGGTGSAPAPPAAATGSASDRTSGASATAGGRSSGSVRGASRTRARDRGPVGGPEVAKLGTGQTVFADSLGDVDAGAAATAKSGAARSSASAPSARSASGDLWGGFASGRDGAQPGLGATPVAENGPGSALALSLALAGLGLAASLAGAGAMALRRRRAPAKQSSD